MSYLMFTTFLFSGAPSAPINPSAVSIESAWSTSRCHTFPNKLVGSLIETNSESGGGLMASAVVG